MQQRRSSGYDHHHHSDYIPAATESQALKEAQNKYRLLEADYKTLHDKRLQDVSDHTTPDYYYSIEKAPTNVKHLILAFS